MTCTAPSLPPGAFKVQAVKANGELSVGTTPLSDAFVSQVFITSLANNAGSLAGGNPLTLNTNFTVS